MASLKRKNAPGENPPAKAVKSTKDSRPTKSKDAKAAEPTVSRLAMEDEPMFPRGGASELTPLELRDIAQRARADAAREQEEFDSRPVSAKVKTKAKGKEKKSKKAKGGERDEPEQEKIKVEGLSFKKLGKGSLVLGQIIEIRPLEVIVALPNNLTGSVSIVNVSEALTNKLGKETGEESEDDEDENDDADETDLKQLFHVGQYVRAHVLSTSDDSDPKKPRRRIQLSLRPSETNTGITPSDVVANMAIMAAVVSVEDHGCIMDLGMGAAGLTGFLARKQIDPAIAGDGLQVGASMLCVVTKKSSDGKVAQLSTLAERVGGISHLPKDAVTINSFLPGTLADLLLTSVSDRGLVGKIIGHLDAVADGVHSGAGPLRTELEKTYKVGTKIKVRIICNFINTVEPKVGFSVLPHVLSLKAQTATSKQGESLDVLSAVPMSSFVEKCRVKRVEDGLGLFVDIGIEGVGGFVHISRVKDGKVEALYQTSGQYQADSVHRGRVVGYSPVDGLVYLSLEKSVLDQKYIRIADIPIGTVLSGSVEKIILGEDGVSGITVKICEGIVGFVPSMHLADVQLQHPERKFREGTKVKARVLSVDVIKHRLRLTLKKTLVNAETPIIASYEDVQIGMQVPCIINEVVNGGARVRFYNNVKGFLPTSHMSEAYVQDAKEHFRVGQVVSVHIIEAVPEKKRIMVSCKDPSAFGPDKQQALQALKVGEFLSAKVSEKNDDEVVVELAGSELKAVLAVGHLSDRSAGKTRTILKGLHVGQTLSDLMVLEKNEARRFIALTQKPCLKAAQKEGKLLSRLEDAKEGMTVQGFVRNIAPSGVVVNLAGGLHGLIPGNTFPKEEQDKEHWGLERWQPMTVFIRNVDLEKRRLLFIHPESVREKKQPAEKTADQGEKEPSRSKGKAVLEGATALVNPVDENLACLDDIKLGMVTSVRIQSIKATQLNVRLADNVQGRVDVSSVFDTWDDISNPRKPLQKFRQFETIKVKVTGVHDTRNHRFLPFSHRSTRSVLELSAKPSDLSGESSEQLTLDGLKVGDTHIAFVNNHGPKCIWANITPTVRGMISAKDVTDDLSLLQDLPKSFPEGTALQVRVTNVDVEHSRLNLSARTSNSSSAVTWENIEPNAVLPAIITKVTDRQVIVHLSDFVSGPIHLFDLSDNYDEVNTIKYNKGDMIRVSVVELDRPNKRLRLSARQSRVLDSTSAVVDPEIRDISQIKNGDVVRGFVKNIADKGLFVTLGGSVVGYVKISNLWDRFVKNWKDEFQIDQLVKARVLSADAITKQVELSLKPSVVDENYVPLKTYSDMKEGQVVTGKIRKVEEYGAFIVVDGSDNVSGLSHKDQMADAAIKDARKLYSEGDAVKAMVLKVDVAKRRISFGLKPSLFDDDTDMSEGGAELEDDSDSDAGVQLEDLELDSDEDADEDEDDEMEHGDDDDEDEDEDEEDEEDEEDVEMDDAPANGLGAGKYDWTADAFEGHEKQTNGASEELSKKKKRKKTADVDRTAQLDVNGPQSTDDYERLLLGQPDSSALWIAYMAFQMQVSGMEEARRVAQRAISTINVREDAEKLNVWVASLNLEVVYGDKSSVDEVFNRACGYADQQEIHERLASIYIQSGKHMDAEALFETMLKKFGSKAPQVWINYANFLHVTAADPTKARSLLPRATQSLPARDHLHVMTRLAALEFRSPNGEAERGRTMFEGLLSTFPKKGDLWGQLLDLELGLVKDGETTGDAVAAVRDVFERRTRAKALKPKPAMKWFARWADWEEKVAGKKGRDRAVKKTEDWVARYKVRKEQEAGEEEEE